MAFILDDILLSPCKFVSWVGRKLHDHAEAELTDESPVRERLLDLQMRFELGQIGAEEYLEQEKALMHRLDEIRKFKETVADR